MIVRTPSLAYGLPTALPTPVATVAAKLRVAMVANKGAATASLRKDRRAVEMEDMRTFPLRETSIPVRGRNGLSNEVDGAGIGPLGQDLADLGAGMAGIAFDAILAVAGLQLVHAHHAGIDGKHQGGIANIGVIADFLASDAALHHFRGIAWR